MIFIRLTINSWSYNVCTHTHTHDHGQFGRREWRVYRHRSLFSDIIQVNTLIPKARQNCLLVNCVQQNSQHNVILRQKCISLHSNGYMACCLCSSCFSAASWSIRVVLILPWIRSDAIESAPLINQSRIYFLIVVFCERTYIYDTQKITHNVWQTEITS